MIKKVFQTVVCNGTIYHILEDATVIEKHISELPEELVEYINSLYAVFIPNFQDKTWNFSHLKETQNVFSIKKVEDGIELFSKRHSLDNLDPEVYTAIEPFNGRYETFPFKV